jgi:chemotaxis response regulator CheB
LDYVKSHPLLQSSKLVAFGESIGGAVAIDIVARNEDQVFTSPVIKLVH